MQDVGADLATFIRAIVVLLALAAILTAAGSWQGPSTISAR